MAYDGQGFFPKSLELALSGQLEDYIARAQEAVMIAARNALVNVTTEAKDRLRAQVVKAGLARDGSGSGRGSGRSLASAVRVEIYPKRGLAHEPAALVYIQPSAVKIYEAFEEGATIRSHSGKYLTIPVPGSPADRKHFGDRPRGQSILDSLIAKGIEISFVPARNGRPAMLVGGSVRLRDKDGRTKVSRAARTKNGGLAAGAASVPLFFLVPSATLPKKLSMRAEFDRTSRDFVAEFAREFERQLALLDSQEGRAA